MEYEDPVTKKWGRIAKVGVDYVPVEEEREDIDTWDANKFIRKREMAWAEDEDVVTNRLDEAESKRREASMKTAPWKVNSPLEFRFSDLGDCEFRGCT